MADAGSPHVLKDLLHEAKNKLIENNGNSSENPNPDLDSVVVL